MQEIMANLITFDVLIALVIGVGGGMIIGALPGLSATMGVALLLPLSFTMKPEAALIMLMAIYTSAITGGGLTAILLHTPGTPASAATVIEGYPLTKQGRGLEACGMAVISSVFGGVFSAVAILLIAPPLAKVSLWFSEPEYFLVAVFGMTIIGSLSGESMLKGLISGVIGLFLGTIGMETSTGTMRFAYGNDYLMSGINMVPAMIGLFSMAQVFRHCENLNSKNAVTNFDKSNISGKMLPTWKELPRYLKTMITSSVIGVFVGILPGAGGNIGSWMSYNEAKRVSKHKDEYGKGSLEGLCACEAGNNAVTGGSFIPLLTMGIPGSPTAAVILGGLMIHGLIPGHRLFGQMADTTYTILIGFLLSNIAMLFIGLLIAKYIANVAKVPQAYLSPIIVVLSVLGSYAINGRMYDVWVMLIFSALGYLIDKFGFPPAPLILALILGPMAENGFTRSLVMAKGNVMGYYFSRPLCVILIILILLSLAAPLVSFLFKKWRTRFAKAI